MKKTDPRFRPVKFPVFFCILIILFAFRMKGYASASELPVSEEAIPYTKVYEPNTSWIMSATVAWRTDSSAPATANAKVRPATAFVWLDSALRVYDRDGGLLSESLESYVSATAGGMIPAFYISDADTAAALKEWISCHGLRDCFVVSTPDHKDLVKDVANLRYVRGMLDYSSVTDPDRAALLDMVASTNGAHGKVIILSQEAAGRDTVRLLQSLASTVWVRSSPDLNSLLTHYTNGVNGIVVDDYSAAIDALELFRDDAPSLLRIPLIIGHRGDPSTYVENTLDSQIGAYKEGVNAIENDIQLSADGKLFILHDDQVRRLYGIEDTDENGEPLLAENQTLEWLKSHFFDWSDIEAENEVPAAQSRYGFLYGQADHKQYTVPSLRELIETFKDTGIVHDTEIKSRDPRIIPVYKALVDEYDAWDQFFTITFNTEILDAIYSDYPEISIGALGMYCYAPVGYDDYDKIAEEEGAEAALEKLYLVIDKWNATYNNWYPYGEKMAIAGRHRGLTVWPWTYRPDAYFAHDYLIGVAGLTTDYPWVASDWIVEISSDDLTLSGHTAIPSPTGTTQDGQKKVLDTAEPVLVCSLAKNKDLMMWRYPAELIIAGQDFGKYYLYSNPFTVTRRSGLYILAGLDGTEDGKRIISWLVLLAGLLSLILVLNLTKRSS